MTPACWLSPSACGPPQKASASVFKNGSTRLIAASEMGSAAPELRLHRRPSTPPDGVPGAVLGAFPNHLEGLVV